MESFTEAWNQLATFMSSGIAGSEFTPLRLLMVVAMTTALVWGTRRATRWFVDRVLAHRGFDIGMREALGAIIRYVVISLGALVILQSAGINLTSLNVLVGAIGVGLGFGLQNITSNFFSGLILLFERPVKIGDRIEIAGVVGEVREIGARATTIVTDENVATIVPNSQLVSERVTNWNRPSRLTAYLLQFTLRTPRTPHSFVKSCSRPRPAMPVCCAIRLRRWSSSRSVLARFGFSSRSGAMSTSPPQVR